eukprot:Clim_evm18s253 gene=Clim_evmTU18s253
MADTPPRDVEDADVPLVIGTIIVGAFLLIYLVVLNSKFVGFVITTTLRFYTKDQNLKLSIGSFVISLMGGKIMFQDLQYFDSDQSIRIYSGYLSIKYWYRHVCMSVGNEEELQKPHRAKLHLVGLEHYMFNRTAAYEYVDELHKRRRETGADTEETQEPLVEDFRHEYPYWARILPSIGIHVRNGCSIIGNNVLKVKAAVFFDEALGYFGATNTECKFDVYRVIMKLKLSKPCVKFIVNNEFLSGGTRRRYQVKTTEPSIDLIETEEMEITVLKDKPGLNTEESLGDPQQPAAEVSITCPHNVNIMYGSVIDHHRYKIQSFMMPWAYEDYAPTPPKRVGAYRSPDGMAFHVNFDGGATVRVPFSGYTVNHAEQPRGELIDDPIFASIPQEFAEAKDCFFIFAEAASTMSYTMPYVITNEGYTADLRLDLHNVDLRTTLPFTRLVNTSYLLVESSMFNGRLWKTCAKWDFNITVMDPDIYFVRDQADFFTALGFDFSVPDNGCAAYFMPLVYKVKIKCNSYRFRTYCNTANIMPNPEDDRDNTTLIMTGDVLTVNAVVPFKTFHPIEDNYNIVINAPNSALSYILPEWHSEGFLRRNDDKDYVTFWTLQTFRFEFDYFYQQLDDSVEARDCFRNTMTFVGAEFWLDGTALRIFLAFVANYFSSERSVLTDPALRAEIRQEKILDPAILIDHQGPDMEIDVRLNAKNNTIYLVDHHTETMSKVGPFLAVNDISVGMRADLKGMELIVNTSPMAVSWGRYVNSGECGLESFSLTQIYNYGPKPNYLSYACSRKVFVGDVIGCMTLDQLCGLLDWADSVRFYLSDEENTPLIDVTDYHTLSLNTCNMEFASVNLVLKDEIAAVVVSVTQPITQESTTLKTPTADERSVLDLRGANISVLRQSVLNKDLFGQDVNGEWIDGSWMTETARIHIPHVQYHSASMTDEDERIIDNQLDFLFNQDWHQQLLPLNIYDDNRVMQEVLERREKLKSGSHLKTDLHSFAMGRWRSQDGVSGIVQGGLEPEEQGSEWRTTHSRRSTYNPAEVMAAIDRIDVEDAEDSASIHDDKHGVVSEEDGDENGEDWFANQLPKRRISSIHEDVDSFHSAASSIDELQRFESSEFQDAAENMEELDVQVPKAVDDEGLDFGDVFNEYQYEDTNATMSSKRKAWASNLDSFTENFFAVHEYSSLAVYQLLIENPNMDSIVDGISTMSASSSFRTGRAPELFKAMVDEAIRDNRSTKNAVPELCPLDTVNTASCILLKGNIVAFFIPESLVELASIGTSLVEGKSRTALKIMDSVRRKYVARKKGNLDLLPERRLQIRIEGITVGLMTAHSVVDPDRREDLDPIGSTGVLDEESQPRSSRDDTSYASASQNHGEPCSLLFKVSLFNIGLDAKTQEGGELYIERPLLEGGVIVGDQFSEKGPWKYGTRRLIDFSYLQVGRVQVRAVDAVTGAKQNAEIDLINVKLVKGEAKFNEEYKIEIPEVRLRTPSSGQIEPLVDAVMAWQDAIATIVTKSKEMHEEMQSIHRRLFYHGANYVETLDASGWAEVRDADVDFLTECRSDPNWIIALFLQTSVADNLTVSEKRVPARQTFEDEHVDITRLHFDSTLEGWYNANFADYEEIQTVSMISDIFTGQRLIAEHYPHHGKSTKTYSLDCNLGSLTAVTISKKGLRKPLVAVDYVTCRGKGTKFRSISSEGIGGKGVVTAACGGISLRSLSALLKVSTSVTGQLSKHKQKQKSTAGQTWKKAEDQDGLLDKLYKGRWCIDVSVAISCIQLSHRYRTALMHLITRSIYLNCSIGGSHGRLMVYFSVPRLQITFMISDKLVRRGGVADKLVDETKSDMQWTIVFMATLSDLIFVHRDMGARKAYKLMSCLGLDIDVPYGIQEVHHGYNAVESIRSALGASDLPKKAQSEVPVDSQSASQPQSMPEPKQNMPSVTVRNLVFHALNIEIGSRCPLLIRYKAEEFRYWAGDVHTSEALWFNLASHSVQVISNVMLDEAIDLDLESEDAFTMDSGVELDDVVLPLPSIHGIMQRAISMKRGDEGFMTISCPKINATNSLENAKILYLAVLPLLDDIRAVAGDDHPRKSSKQAAPVHAPAPSVEKDLRGQRTLRSRFSVTLEVESLMYSFTTANVNMRVGLDHVTGHYLKSTDDSATVTKHFFNVKGEGIITSGYGGSEETDHENSKDDLRVAVPISVGQDFLAQHERKGLFVLLRDLDVVVKRELISCLSLILIRWRKIDTDVFIQFSRTAQAGQKDGKERPKDKWSAKAAGDVNSEQSEKTYVHLEIKALGIALTTDIKDPNRKTVSAVKLALDRVQVSTDGETSVLAQFDRAAIMADAAHGSGSKAWFPLNRQLINFVSAPRGRLDIFRKHVRKKARTALAYALSWYMQGFQLDIDTEIGSHYKMIMTTLDSFQKVLRANAMQAEEPEDSDDEDEGISTFESLRRNLEGFIPTDTRESETAIDVKIAIDPGFALLHPENYLAKMTDLGEHPQYSQRPRPLYTDGPDELKVTRIPIPSATVSVHLSAIKKTGIVDKRKVAVSIAFYQADSDIFVNPFILTFFETASHNFERTKGSEHKTPPKHVEQPSLKERKLEQEDDVERDEDWTLELDESAYEKDYDIMFILHVPEMRVTLSSAPLSHVRAEILFPALDLLLTAQSGAVDLSVSRPKALLPYTVLNFFIDEFKISINHEYSPKSGVEISVQNIRFQMSTSSSEGAGDVVSMASSIGFVSVDFGVRQLDEVQAFRKIWMSRSTRDLRTSPRMSGRPQMAVSSSRGNLYTLRRRRSILSVPVLDTSGSRGQPGKTKIPLYRRITSRFLFVIDTFRVNTNLGQISNAAMAHIDRLSLTSFMGPEGSYLEMSHKVHCESFSLSFEEGLLTGYVAMEHSALGIVMLHPRRDDEQRAHRVLASAHAHSTQAMLRYFGDRVVVADVLQFSARFLGFDDLSETAIPEARLIIDTASMDVAVSKATLPSLMALSNEITVLYEEEKHRFETSFAEMFDSGRTTSSPNVFREEESESKSDLGPRPPKFWTAKVLIGGGHFMLAMFQETMSNPVFSNFSALNYRLSFSRNTVATDDGIWIETALRAAVGVDPVENDAGAGGNIPSATVRKMECRYPEVLAESEVPVSDFLRVLQRDVTSTKIFVMPPSHLALRSNSRVHSHRIYIKFNTEFEGPLLVSGDIGLYMFINNLIRLYINANEKEMANRASRKYSRDVGLSPRARDSEPPSPRELPPSKGKGSSGSSPGGSSSTSYSPMDDGAIGGAHPLTGPPKTYVVESYSLDPKIRLTTLAVGNFTTPDVEWILQKLGFENARESIPKYTHIGVIEILDAILEQVVVSVVAFNREKHLQNVTPR